MNLIKAITIAMATLVSGIAFANVSDDLSVKLKSIETFEGKFSQVIKDDKDKLLNESYGFLKVKRPGRFYWKSETPDELLVVADGQTIWTYDIELEQIVKQDQLDSMGQSPAALLAGEVVDLSSEYDIRLSDKPCQGQADSCFLLSPKQEGQFKQITIGFSGKDLSMIYMQDALDQVIYTQFVDTKTNEPIDDNLFDFVPPAGVDVILGNQ